MPSLPLFILQAWLFLPWLYTGCIFIRIPVYFIDSIIYKLLFSNIFVIVYYSKILPLPQIISPSCSQYGKCLKKEYLAHVLVIIYDKWILLHMYYPSSQISCINTIIMAQLLCHLLLILFRLWHITSENINSPSDYNQRFTKEEKIARTTIKDLVFTK